MPNISEYSRFHNTPTYIDSGKNTLYSMWVPPKYGDVQEFSYNVTAQDIDRPDLISYKLFGTVELWWMILDFNHISDPFSLSVGQKLRIPYVSAVNQIVSSFQNLPQQTAISTSNENFAVTRIINPKILPFQRPPTTATTTSVTAPFLFNFAFPVPEGLSSLVSFQIQISEVPDFSVIIASKMTQTSTKGWFFYSPSANNGAGSFMAFPSAGIDGAVFASQTVYYKVTREDLGNTLASEYYFRYRAWQNNIEGAWFISPPLVIK